MTTPTATNFNTCSRNCAANAFIHTSVQITSFQRGDKASNRILSGRSYRKKRASLARTIAGICQINFTQNLTTAFSMSDKITVA
jgi:hypothetical protein